MAVEFAHARRQQDLAHVLLGLQTAQAVVVVPSAKAPSRRPRRRRGLALHVIALPAPVEAVAGAMRPQGIGRGDLIFFFFIKMIII